MFNTPDNLEVIREEQCSPAISTILTDAKAKSKVAMAKSNASVGKESMKSTREPDIIITSNVLQDRCPCTGDAWGKMMEERNAKTIDPEVIEKLLAEKEAALRREFHETLTNEVTSLKEKFDYILHNEQVRASYMLREAHRERQEKIKALQSQLECKNLAGLMYVMCTERKKSKFEKMKIIEEYTTYVNCLHDILTDGQKTILHLSRGYKSAARLDHEWQEKMKAILGEFQKFVEHYMGDNVDSSQYFFDIPKLLKSDEPKIENPSEDPIDTGPPQLPEIEPEKPWFEQLDNDCPPFVVYGDMGEFKAHTRQQVLNHVKAKKTAPERWKQYAFQDMFLKSGCTNAKDIRDVYFQRLPSQTRWECQGVQTIDGSIYGKVGSDTYSRRVTTASIDMRCTMGSMLKLITASGINQNQSDAKAILLGARDSMEIVSATKLRESDEKRSIGKRSTEKRTKSVDYDVRLPIGRRRTSFFEERKYFDLNFRMSTADISTSNEKQVRASAYLNDKDISVANVRQIAHQDSLDVISHHVPDKDHTVHEAKYCPMDQCRRTRMDSFLRTLPAYMRAKPFTHIEQSFDAYETCTPEQLEVLQQRIQEKKKKEKRFRDMVDNPLKEWMTVAGEVGTQTSPIGSMSDLPPCTCAESNTTDFGDQGKMFDLKDLIPVKQQFDTIAAECLFDSSIDFNRFKVVGEDSNISMKPEPVDEPIDFTSKRLYQIKKILKEHPSLCSLFQANSK